MTERGTTPGRDPRMGLSFDDHRRDGADRTMVYPVMSRRAGGLSIGVNLNLGQECNWACVYCEVEGLVRGAPGPVDLARLEQELDAVLTEASSGRWSNGTTGEGLPAEIKDISIAGDGEPTLSPQFDGAVEVCARLRQQHGLEGSARLVVITNGSRLHVPEVESGVRRLGEAGGSLWFKLDGGTPAAREEVNDVAIPDERVEANLVLATAACATWVQCMVLSIDGQGPSDEELDRRVELLERACEAGARPAGVVIYGLARPSQQPGAHRLSPLAGPRLEAIAARFEGLHLPLHVVE